MRKEVGKLLVGAGMLFAAYTLTGDALKALALTAFVLGAVVWIRY